MVDEKARNVESDIDGVYRTHPLLQYRYTDALHSILVAANELLGDFRGAERQTYGVAVDTIINGLKYALGWLWQERRRMSDLARPDVDPVPFAKTLIQLAVEYVGVVAAYTYGSENILDLHLDGQTLKPSGELLRDSRYEAYNQLLKTAIESARSRPSEEDPLFFEEVKNSWQHGVPFPALPMARNVLAVTYRMMDEHSAAFYDLPNSWRFQTFSLAAFRAVHNVLAGIIYTWARIATVLELAGQEMPHGPALPFSVTKRELLSAIKDIAALPASEIKPVLAVLEYAGAGIKSPDPAIQPLIPLPSGHLLLSVPLILGAASERNLAVLVNRLPAERDAYSHLTNEKEAAMRHRITRRLPPHWQAWTGRLPGRKDVTDLAVIDPIEHSLLFLELKWFIDPAEVQELLNRSKELSKGVDQCKQLLTLSLESPNALDRIPGSPFQQVAAAVVSFNWIGFSDVQNADVPIINEEHFLSKLERCSKLADVMAWLRSREYLPIEGRDYKVEDRPTYVGDWSLEWYRIVSLRPEEAFMPL